MNASYTSLFSLLSHAKETHPSKPALYVKQKGHYHPLTYTQVFQKVKAFALGLHALGIVAGESISILSGNRPEWVIADFAALSQGILDVPIYPTLTPLEIQHILVNSRSRAIVVETRSHLDSVLSILNQCPDLKYIIVMMEIMTPFEKTSSHCLSFQEILAKGKKASHQETAEWEKRTQDLQLNQAATIVYTSGTTGSPKGVVLTHGNILSNVQDILAITPLSSHDTVLSFLPLCHVFERTVGYYTLLAVCGTIYYAENITTVSQNMVETKPTILVSVPRLYEKIQAKLLDDLTGLKRKLFFWAFGIGQKYNSRQKNKSFCFTLCFLHFIADHLVFSKIRAKTGGKLRFFVSGGAPLPKEIGRFFENIGFIILEGYGMTESSPVIACNRLNSYKFGTVGQVLPSQTVMLAEDGELLVKGPNVMTGYFELPDATEDVIDTEGWLHTGDIAEIDTEGFVKIIDRKKELIVLSNGKKIPPQVIEQKLVISPFIAQSVVIGEGHSYLVALIVPNIPRLIKFVSRRQLAYHTTEELLALPQVHALFSGIVYRKLIHFANYEKIKTFRLLEHEFTPESGELTPTLKPRRRVIYKNYAKEIASMYEEGKGPK